MKVLIVEDSYLLQFRLSKALSIASDDINLRQAMTCKDALDIFRLFNPDVIILDIELPDGSGIDLLRDFKKVKQDVHVIIFTNFPTSEFKKNCMDLGADHFYEKTQTNQLLMSVRELHENLIQK